ncbi:hypothetical protein KKI24_00550 [bacterium]|nr:hypothetical protein [bacterium]
MASVNFCMILLVADIAILEMLILYHVIAGGIFSLLGINEVIQIPKGW